MRDAELRASPSSARHAGKAAVMNVMRDDVPRIVLSRMFKAPRELVFQMFTDPEHLERDIAKRCLEEDADRRREVEADRRAECDRDDRPEDPLPQHAEVVDERHDRIVDGRSGRRRQRLRIRGHG